jgi:hypothetical protein
LRSFCRPLSFFGFLARLFCLKLSDKLGQLFILGIRALLIGGRIVRFLFKYELRVGGIVGRLVAEMFDPVFIGPGINIRV